MSKMFMSWFVSYDSLSESSCIWMLGTNWLLGEVIKHLGARTSAKEVCYSEQTLDFSSFIICISSSLLLVCEWKYDQLASCPCCHAFPAVIDFIPWDPEAIIKPSFLKLLFIMTFYHFNRKIIKKLVLGVGKLIPLLFCEMWICFTCHTEVYRKFEKLLILLFISHFLTWKQ